MDAQNLEMRLRQESVQEASASATDLASAGPGRTEETSYLQNEEVGEM